jgi:hypothetical protein
MLPKPGPGRTSRFTRRWSCSTMLFKYLDYRRQAKRHSSSAAFISATARIGRVLVDGDGTRIDRVRLLSALQKNRFAAAASRCAASKKSIVSPWLSTALANCLTRRRVRPCDWRRGSIRRPLRHRFPGARSGRPWPGRAGTLRRSPGVGEDGNGRRSCCAPRGTAGLPG